MKLLSTLCILLILTACSDGSSTSELLENAKDILDQHACLEGTWQADTQFINIDGQTYSIAPSQTFIIITEPKDISEFVNLGEDSINYAGLKLRTWISENNQTTDAVTESWVATLTSENKATSGSLKLIDSCITEYEGKVNESSTPQCTDETLTTTTHDLILDCTDNANSLKISNTSMAISFQRIHDNSSIANFNTDTSSPINLDATLDSKEEILNTDEILAIIKQAFPGLSELEIQQKLGQALASNFISQGDEPALPLAAPNDSDQDNDGINDDMDAFPNNPLEWSDLDSDGIGDNSDDDIDGDTYSNNNDAFPRDITEWADLDNDGIGNNSDNDIDGDTHSNNNDAFPNDATEWADLDNDGIGNNSDNDIDGDTHLNNNDVFPNDVTEWADLDNDGIGNNSDDDIDGDTYLNDNDLFPIDATEWADLDNDGVGNNSDGDIDGDGYLNEDDIAPLDPTLPESSILMFVQDFDSFENGSSWYLTDFNLPDSPNKSDYIHDGEILFDLQWTNRTRKLLADALGYERSEMTKALANLLCPPKIEVGRASTYQAGTSDNMIAELDSDLYHCNINGNEPASVKLRSFIPTQVGYRYRLSAAYSMRTYNNQPANAYRHFVMGFAGTVEHFPPAFNDFENVNIEITATNKFSRMILLDNGLPDSYGILIDNIQIENLGKVAHYNVCSTIFAQNSKGFKKCIKQEVDTNQICEIEAMSINYQPNNVALSRMHTENLFLQEPATTSHINFVSLGKNGKLTTRCLIDGYPALFPIYNKRLSLNEISWGNVTAETYPEQGRISVKLSNCLEDELNGRIQLGTINTSEYFTYDFTHNDTGLSYEGCQLKQLIIKDKTPSSSPSSDGIDLNSLNFSDIE
ncbi:hypothetical protein ACU6U9_04815 [Pseudomonas sp. HK3]